MEEKRKSVKVSIFGDEYPIRGDTDSGYILNIANYVDAKMREVSEKVPKHSQVKVAVLAAMNIADELFKERKDKERRLSEVETKASSLIQWLDNKLKEE